MFQLRNSVVATPHAVDDIDGGGSVVVMINGLITKGERAAKQLTALGKRVRAKSRNMRFEVE